jgi:lysophospholipid acyltransferase (LPLAT)-like uncharacterized protein
MMVTALLIFYMELVIRSCKSELRIIGKSKALIRKTSPAIFTCWHGRFMMFLPLRKIGNFQAVVSAHKDGEYLANILMNYNYMPVRGSSRKKGTEALREIFKIPAKELRLVITPDGPLGPRFKVKGGVIKLARKLKVPVIPISYSASKAIIMKTWDRFIIPIPFISRLLFEVGAPIDYKDLSMKNLEQIMNEQFISLDKKLELKI